MSCEYRSSCKTCSFAPNKYMFVIRENNTFHMYTAHPCENKLLCAEQILMVVRDNNTFHMYALVPVKHAALF